MPISTRSSAPVGTPTPQSRNRPERGPVLAFVPDERSLHFAMDLARGYSLAVVEGSTPLAEWAAGAAALNLLTGQITTSQLDDDVRKDLDSVILYGGRNGWTGADEKAQVRRYLSDHVSGRRLTPDQAAAYALSSHSVSERGAKRLRELLGRPPVIKSSDCHWAHIAHMGAMGNMPT
jgi:hypothetical protein